MAPRIGTASGTNGIYHFECKKQDKRFMRKGAEKKFSQLKTNIKKRFLPENSID
jgi:hypothetical protein